MTEERDLFESTEDEGLARENPRRPDEGKFAYALRLAGLALPEAGARAADKPAWLRNQRENAVPYLVRLDRIFRGRNPGEEG